MGYNCRITGESRTAQLFVWMVNGPHMATRITIVGAGKIGHKHASVLHSIRGAEVAHIVDVDPEAAERTAEAVDATVITLEEALSNTDAVYVCTPDGNHAGIARDAIDAGAHTFVEKPLAVDPEAAGELVAAADKSDAVHMVGHILRFDTRYRRLKRTIDGDGFGSVCAAMATRLVSRGRVRRTGDVSTSDTSGPAMRLGVHDFDILQWLVDAELAAVSAHSADGKLRAEGYDVADVVTIAGEFTSGATASLTLGFCLPHGHPGSIVDTTIIGTEQTAQLDASGAETQVWDDDGGSYLDTHLWPEINGHPDGALERESRQFLNMIDVDGGSPVPFAAGYSAVAVAAAIERAIKTREYVSVERSVPT